MDSSLSATTSTELTDFPQNKFWKAPNPEGIMLTLINKTGHAFSHVPWQSFMTVEPIEQLVNAPVEQQNERTRAWKEAKLEELSLVGLAVRTLIISSATVATKLTYS
jgi:hypothetical protein